MSELDEEPKGAGWIIAIKLRRQAHEIIECSALQINRVAIRDE